MSYIVLEMIATVRVCFERAHAGVLFCATKCAVCEADYYSTHAALRALIDLYGIDQVYSEEVTRRVAELEEDPDSIADEDADEDRSVPYTPSRAHSKACSERAGCACGVSRDRSRNRSRDDGPESAYSLDD